MDSDVFQMSKLTDSESADVRELDIQRDNAPRRISPQTLEAKQKEKKPVGCFDVVAIAAFVLAALSLILCLILVTNGLNQPSGNQGQQNIEQVKQPTQPDIKPTQRPTDFQAFQAQINTLMSIQFQLNSTILGIQAQMNNSLLSLQVQINESKGNFLMEAQQQQQSIINQERKVLEVYKNSTAQRIDDLQSYYDSLFGGVQNAEREIQKISLYLTSVVDTELSALQENIVTHTNQLQSLIRGLQSLNSTIQELNTFSNNSQIGSFVRPATSCRDIPPGSVSGNYWIQTNFAVLPIQVYCDTNQRRCNCSSSGGWMRVANLDMTDPRQECPLLFQLVTRSQSPRRTCGRPSGTTGCVSTTFPVYGIEYSRVCGRMVGYQVGSPSGFETGTSSINSHYMAGISLTHGSPRQHIWSLVNAQGEGFTGEVCPCISQGSVNDAPSFVGNDYFCDSAIRDTDVNNGVFYPDDPLWDGQGCGSGSTCCEFNNPPWFCKQLPEPTTDDIEFRLCENSGQNYDDTPFEIVELYIN